MPQDIKAGLKEVEDGEGDEAEEANEAAAVAAAVAAAAAAAARALAALPQIDTDASRGASSRGGGRGTAYTRPLLSST